jgi:hypothetical protein
MKKNNYFKLPDQGEVQLLFASGVLENSMIYFQKEILSLIARNKNILLNEFQDGMYFELQDLKRLKNHPNQELAKLSELAFLLKNLNETMRILINIYKNTMDKSAVKFNTSMSKILHGFTVDGFNINSNDNTTNNYEKKVIKKNLDDKKAPSTTDDFGFEIANDLPKGEIGSIEADLARRDRLRAIEERARKRKAQEKAAKKKQVDLPFESNALDGLNVHPASGAAQLTGGPDINKINSIAKDDSLTEKEKMAKINNILDREYKIM